MSGGGSKLLNNPVDHGKFTFTTKNWNSQEFQDIDLDLEPGLYFIQLDFILNLSGVKPTGNIFQFGLKIDEKTVYNTDYSNSAGLYSFVSTIAVIKSTSSIKMIVGTDLDGVKFDYHVTTTKLRSDV